MQLFPVRVRTIPIPRKVGADLLDLATEKFKAIHGGAVKVFQEDGVIKATIGVPSLISLNEEVVYKQAVVAELLVRKNIDAVESGRRHLERIDRFEDLMKLIIKTVAKRVKTLGLDVDPDRGNMCVMNSGWMVKYSANVCLNNGTVLRLNVDVKTTAADLTPEGIERVVGKVLAMVEQQINEQVER